MREKSNLLYYLIIAFLAFHYLYFIGVTCCKGMNGDFGYQCKIAPNIVTLSSTASKEQISRVFKIIPGAVYLPIYYSMLNSLIKVGYDTAFIFWTLINQIIFLAALYMLIKAIKPKPSLSDIALTTFVVVNFLPVIHNIIGGQVSFLVLLSLSGCLYCLITKREIPAGIFMALGISIKWTPILFLPFLIWKKRYKCVLACLLVLFVIFLISVMRYGVYAHFIQIFQIIPSEMARMCGIIPDHSILAVFKRLLSIDVEGTQGILDAPFLANILIFIYLSTVIIVAVKRLFEAGRETSAGFIFEFAFLICTILLISSWVAIYHMVWTIIPILAVFLNEGTIRRSVIWMCIASFILLGSEYWPDGLAFSRNGWGVMLLIGRQIGLVLLWVGLYAAAASPRSLRRK